MCPFYEITGFTLTLLKKSPRTQNSEKVFREATLFPGANLILRPALRWCWVFLKRTRILYGIQLTRHFIKLIVVETKHFVGCSVNVILTWQSRGQRAWLRDANAEC